MVPGEEVGFLGAGAFEEKKKTLSVEKDKIESSIRPLGEGDFGIPEMVDSDTEDEKEAMAIEGEEDEEDKEEGDVECEVCEGSIGA